MLAAVCGGGGSIWRLLLLSNGDVSVRGAWDRQVWKSNCVLVLLTAFNVKIILDVFSKQLTKCYKIQPQIN